MCQPAHESTNGIRTFDAESKKAPVGSQDRLAHTEQHDPPGLVESKNKGIPLGTRDCLRL